MKLTTIEFFLARLLAVGAAGVLVGAATAPIAQYFDYSLAPAVQYTAAALAAILAWFASRKAFDFTADCLDVSPASLTPALHRRALPRPAPESAGTANAVDLVEQRRPGGEVNLSITAHGLTKREFNTLRARLESVPGIRWSRPVNHHDGRRAISGTVPPGSRAALARVRELTGKTV